MFGKLVLGQTHDSQTTLAVVECQERRNSKIYAAAPVLHAPL